MINAKRIHFNFQISRMFCAQIIYIPNYINDSLTNAFRAPVNISLHLKKNTIMIHVWFFYWFHTLAMKWSDFWTKK